jgi:hypothetical protein
MSFNPFLLSALAPWEELFWTLQIDAVFFEQDGKRAKFRKQYFPSLLLILAPLRLARKYSSGRGLHAAFDLGCRPL